MSKMASAAMAGLLLTATAAHAQFYEHQQPRQLDDGWEVGTLAEVGLDYDQVKKVVTQLGYTHGTSDLRSILAARHGKLVVEQYLNSYSVETLHDVRSAGKSFTGALVGIAIDRGLLPGADARVVDLFASRMNDTTRKGKEAITLEHLLTMSSGMDADADDPSSAGFEIRMKEASDFVDFVLALPMAFEPGTEYRYNSAAAYLAGAAVEEATGRSLAEFADEALFEPLGIQQYYWTRGPKHTTYGMGGLYLTSRDFAKLGALYLAEGRWQGRQVVSASWVRDSLRSRFAVEGPPFLQTGYGRLWLVAERKVAGRSFEVFYASGNGGNIMAIVPSLDLVVSLQQSAYGRGYPHFRAFAAIDGMIEACLDPPSATDTAPPARKRPD